MDANNLRALAERLFVAMSFHDPASDARKALIETVAYLRAQADAQPVAAVPAGWKLVPVEPTPEMLASTSWPGCAGTDYAHMLAAAPAAPQSAQQEK